MNHDERNGIKILSSEYLTFLCGNCKKKIHCIAGTTSKDKAPEMLKDRCNHKNCECRCRRYYVAKNGRLRPYGEPDQSSELEGFSPNLPRTEMDDLLDNWKNKENP